MSFGFQVEKLSRFAEAPENIRYAFPDSRKDILISEWLPFPKSNLAQGEIAIQDLKTLKRILPKQDNLKIVFDLSKDQNLDKPANSEDTFAFDVGALCIKVYGKEREKLYFKDLTKESSHCAGAEGVKEGDL